MQYKIGVVGLGYVGLPVAISLSKKYQVTGFDIDINRINNLKNFIDYTNEVSSKELECSNIFFTNETKYIKDLNFIIVAVPTPINSNKQPDLTILESACEIIGRNFSSDTIIVFESTVYPGTTEEICIPILEKASGFKVNKDFYVGYSPERINPGDKNRTFSKITKIVSAQSEEISEIIANIYGSVIEAGIFKATSIKVAEAAKVIENTQRDINIALMNEISVILDKLNINTKDVLAAANTKWNFLDFRPGLVGGHCIGVDPYYLTYKAQEVGHNPEVILSGRKINDGMGKYIASKLLKLMIQRHMNIKKTIVTVLGLTFKENVPDLRNSKVFDIINELEDYGVQVQVSDPLANQNEAKSKYGINIVEINDLKPSEIIILAVSHDYYKNRGWDLILNILGKSNGIVFDLKNVLDDNYDYENIFLWRL